MSDTDPPGAVHSVQSQVAQPPAAMSSPVPACGHTASLLRLPNEILVEIMQHLIPTWPPATELGSQGPLRHAQTQSAHGPCSAEGEDEDEALSNLAKVCRTSRRLAAIARPLLYTQITIKTQDQLKSLLKTLGGYPPPNEGQDSSSAIRSFAWKGHFTEQFVRGWRLQREVELPGERRWRASHGWESILFGVLCRIWKVKHFSFEITESKGGMDSVDDWPAPNYWKDSFRYNVDVETVTLRKPGGPARVWACDPTAIFRSQYCPLVRRLEISGMFHLDDDIRPAPQVEELILDRYGFPDHGSYKLVALFPRLRRLSLQLEGSADWTWGLIYEGGMPGIPRPDFSRDLLRLRGTLEVFSMTSVRTRLWEYGNVARRPPLVFHALRKMSNLRELTVEGIWLWGRSAVHHPPPSERALEIASQLPRSLASLTLIDFWGQPLWDVAHGCELYPYYPSDFADIPPSGDTDEGSDTDQDLFFTKAAVFWDGVLDALHSGCVSGRLPELRRVELVSYLFCKGRPDLMYPRIFEGLPEELPFVAKFRNLFSAAGIEFSCVADWEWVLE